MSKEIDSHILDIYEIKTFLGSGAYGHVWKVIDRHSQKQYALKKIFDAFQNSVDAQRTYREVTVLHQLDHDNIVKLHYVIKANNNKDLYLVFEYMETDLHSIMGENILNSSHIKFIIYQISKVLKYLHSAQIIHRDLKSSNILINSNCEIKICDFGLVRSLTREEGCPMILSQDVATRWYRSPEMLLGSTSYGKATDMWSFGCIVAELVIGNPIFSGSNTIQQLQKILQFTGKPKHINIDSIDSSRAQTLISQLKIKKRPLKSYFKQCEEQILEIIMKMLEFDPENRITAEQILSLPCLQQFRGKSIQYNCNKFILPGVDDNVRLSLEDYRRLIYRDIERRYPHLNKTITIPRLLRTHNSLKSKTSTIEQPHRSTANSLVKYQNKYTNIYSLHNQSSQCKQNLVRRRFHHKKHQERSTNDISHYINSPSSIQTNKGNPSKIIKRTFHKNRDGWNKDVSKYEEKQSL